MGMNWEEVPRRIEEFDTIGFSEHPTSTYTTPAPEEAVRGYESQGLHNGRLLAKLDSRPQDGAVEMLCGPRNFFDILFYKQSPIVCASSILRTRDSKLVLINRGAKVSSFPDYWDCPAGLVVYQEGQEIEEMMLARLQNRLRADLRVGIEEVELMDVQGLFPITCTVQEYMNFFYDVTWNVDAETARAMFEASFANDTKFANWNRPVLIGRDELEDFLATHPVVFSEVYRRKAEEIFATD